MDAKSPNFPELCVWMGCIISITDNLNFDIELGEIFKMYWKTFCTKLSYAEWLKGGKRQEGLSFKGLSKSPKKSDKQNIFSEILAFPLQLVLHERLVSARLLRLWHDPPLLALLKLWQSYGNTLLVSFVRPKLKTKASVCINCTIVLLLPLKKRRLHDNHFKHQVSESG